MNETAGLLFSVTFAGGTDAAAWERNVSATLAYPLETERAAAATSYSASTRRISRRARGHGGGTSGILSNAAAMYVAMAVGHGKGYNQSAARTYPCRRALRLPAAAQQCAMQRVARGALWGARCIVAAWLVQPHETFRLGPRTAVAWRDQSTLG